MVSVIRKRSDKMNHLREPQAGRCKTRFVPDDRRLGGLAVLTADTPEARSGLSASDLAFLRESNPSTKFRENDGQLEHTRPGLISQLRESDMGGRHSSMRLATDVSLR